MSLDDVVSAIEKPYWLHCSELVLRAGGGWVPTKAESKTIVERFAKELVAHHEGRATNWAVLGLCLDTDRFVAAMKKEGHFRVSRRNYSDRTIHRVVKALSSASLPVSPNPPDIRVRDFGSLNGTYLNGQLIGRRKKGMTPEEGAQMMFPEHELKDGDEVELGDTIFRVGIFVPARCVDCPTEIPEEQQSQFERSPGIYQCAACRKKAEAAPATEPPRTKPKVCAKCGKDVTGEIGEHRHGEFICAACKRNPFEIVKRLIRLAKSGDKDLVAIQGYEIIQELGRGGMGAVYLARHEKSQEQVALKVMLPQVAADEHAKRIFLREIENTKLLKHRHVVQLRDAGSSQGTFFFTLEYCDGGSVDKRICLAGTALLRHEPSDAPISRRSTELFLQLLQSVFRVTQRRVEFDRGPVGADR